MSEYTITVSDAEYNTVARGSVTLPDTIAGPELDELVASAASTVVAAFVDGLGNAVEFVAKRRDRDISREALTAIARAGASAIRTADAPWPSHLDLPTSDEEVDARLAPDLTADPDFVRDEAEANPDPA